MFDKILELCGRPESISNSQPNKTSNSPTFFFCYSQIFPINFLSEQQAKPGKVGILFGDNIEIVEIIIRNLFVELVMKVESMILEQAKFGELLLIYPQFKVLFLIELHNNQSYYIDRSLANAR